MAGAGRLRFSLTDDERLAASGGGAAIRADVNFGGMRMSRDTGDEADDGGPPLDSVPAAPATRAAPDARLAQLSDAQRDCLRLVYRHMTSKDIARALNVSPHTVDMRLRTAIRILAVASRTDAARLLIDAEGGPDAYQPLIYQASDVAERPLPATIEAPVSTASSEYADYHPDARFRPDDGPPAGAPPRPAGAPQLDADREWSLSDERYNRRAAAPLSVPLPWGHRNNLGAGARLAWIAAIAIGSAMGFGAILGALEALKQLL